MLVGYVNAITPEQARGMAPHHLAPLRGGSVRWPKAVRDRARGQSRRATLTVAVEPPAACAM